MIAAATAREQGRLEVFVNISQMTVSQRTLTDLTGSPQHLLHLLAELVLNWSGLPVVHVRPTVFLENPFFLDFAAEWSTLRLTSVEIFRVDAGLRTPSVPSADLEFRVWRRGWVLARI
jgi:hypothetical protein